MAEEGGRPGAQQRREEVRAIDERRVPNNVHVVMDRMKPTLCDQPADLLVAEAESEQLGSGNDAELSPRELRGLPEPATTATRIDFSPSGGQFLIHVQHAAEPWAGDPS